MSQAYRAITAEDFAKLQPGDELYCHSELLMTHGAIAAYKGKTYPIVAKHKYWVDIVSVVHSLHSISAYSISDYFGLPVRDAEMNGANATAAQAGGDTMTEQA